MRRLVLIAALLMSASMTSAADLPRLPSSAPRPYLDPSVLPDSLALLPPPPAPSSPAFAADEAAHAAAQRLRSTPRWDRAISDADVHFPHAAEVFSCAANIEISQQMTPHLYALLERTLLDIKQSTYAAKSHYRRVRPFVANNETTCTPAEEAGQRNDGSYPSGHSAAGWGWALLLTEIVPDRANEILQRGRDFGQSRVVCNSHWQSDIDAGRVIGAATLARLQADPAFQADLAAARAEADAQRASHSTPDANACAAEAASLRTDG